MRREHDGIGKYADIFYRTQAWRKCREDYLVFVGRECERCRKEGLAVPAEEVHHKIRITRQNINDPSITLNFANLEALCEDCHKAEHKKKIKMRTDIFGHVDI